MLIQNNEARNLRKQIHTTGVRTDFWACPFKSWFSASFFSDMNFLDEIQATQNISYIIQPPNFCWGEKNSYIPLNRIMKDQRTLLLKDFIYSKSHLILTGNVRQRKYDSFKVSLVILL